MKNNKMKYLNANGDNSVQELAQQFFIEYMGSNCNVSSSPVAIKSWLTASNYEGNIAQASSDVSIFISNNICNPLSSNSRAFLMALFLLGALSSK